MNHIVSTKDLKPNSRAEQQKKYYKENADKIRKQNKERYRARKDAQRNVPENIASSAPVLRTSSAPVLRMNLAWAIAIEREERRMEREEKLESRGRKRKASGDVGQEPKRARVVKSIPKKKPPKPFPNQKKN